MNFGLFSPYNGNNFCDRRNEAKQVKWKEKTHTHTTTTAEIATPATDGGEWGKVYT